MLWPYARRFVSKLFHAVSVSFHPDEYIGQCELKDSLESTAETLKTKALVGKMTKLRNLVTRGLVSEQTVVLRRGEWKGMFGFCQS